MPRKIRKRKNLWHLLYLCLRLQAPGIFASTLFDLKIRIGKIGISLYWVFPLIVAIVLLAAGGVDAKIVWQEFTSNTAMNPLKILVLFLSMTGLSVYLDEIGFFRWLANSTLKKAGTSQKKLFLLLYIVDVGSDGFYVKRRHNSHVHSFHLLFCQKLRR